MTDPTKLAKALGTMDKIEMSCQPDELYCPRRRAFIVSGIDNRSRCYYNFSFIEFCKIHEFRRKWFQCSVIFV